MTCSLCTKAPFSMSFTSSWTKRGELFLLNSTLWTTTLIFIPFSLGHGTCVTCSGSKVRREGGCLRRYGEQHFMSTCRKPSARSGLGHAMHRQLPWGRDTSTGEPTLKPSAVIKPGPSLHLCEPRSDESTDKSFRDVIIKLILLSVLFYDPVIKSMTLVLQELRCLLCY